MSFAGTNDHIGTKAEYVVYLDGIIVENGHYPFIDFRNEVYMPLSYNILKHLDFSITTTDDKLNIDPFERIYQYKWLPLNQKLATFYKPILNILMRIPYSIFKYYYVVRKVQTTIQELMCNWLHFT